jgi:hypothetical protein
MKLKKIQKKFQDVLINVLILNLKFKLQNENGLNDDGITTNIFKRYIARKMAWYIFKDGATHYQFLGWSGSLKKEYNMCLADKYQLMHWILFNVGYDCCITDIMERCGISYEEWKKQEMNKEVFK